MIEAWYDGACEPINPGGHASWGIVIKKDGKTIHCDSGYVGHGPLMSNNVAEYTGSIAVMKWVLKHYPKEPVKIYGDNKMSIMQLSGKWKAKKGLYIKFFEEAVNLKKQFNHAINFEWIPREYNSDADRWSKVALKKRGIHVKVRGHVPALQHE